MVEVTCENQELKTGEQLRLLATKGNVESILRLLTANIRVINSKDEGGYTALQKASAEGHLDAIRVLIKNGANVDTQDSYYGNTALHEAAWKGHSRTVELLAKAKAKVYVRNKGGFAPLHLACQNGHNQSCREVLLANCKPDIKNNYGDTPLHTAARYGHAGVTRILLSARASPKEVNKNGDTSLHIAAAMGRRKLTKILLEAGSSQTTKNKQNETAIDIAQRKEYTEILEILRNPPPIITHEERMKKERDDTKKKHENSKKKEKSNDSGTSSRDSVPRPKDKKIKKDAEVEPNGKSSKITFSGVNWSPYGCHCSHSERPIVDAPKNEALPLEPLKSGEQYFVDLAGNIKKGPISINNTCKCAPLFEKVHHKMQKDKRDLMDHIDAANTKLGNRISSLESHTKNHIDKLGVAVTQKLTSERAECRDRSDRLEDAATKEISSRVAQLRQWVENKINTEHLDYSRYKRRSSLDGGRDSIMADFPLTRSRSDEGISEFHDEEEPVYKGLRVLDHPTSLFNIPQVIQIDQDPSQNSYNSRYRRQRHLSDGYDYAECNGGQPNAIGDQWRPPNFNAKIHSVNGRPPELNGGYQRKEQIEIRHQMMDRNIKDLNNIVDNLDKSDRRKPLPLNYSFDREFAPRPMHDGNSVDDDIFASPLNKLEEPHQNLNGSYSGQNLHVLPIDMETRNEPYLPYRLGSNETDLHVLPSNMKTSDTAYLSYGISPNEADTYIDMDRCKIAASGPSLPEINHKPVFPLESPNLLRPPMEGFTEQDSHNDSGYSTRLCSTSRGPSPNILGPTEQKPGDIPNHMTFRNFNPNSSRLSLPSPTISFRHQSPAFPRMFEQRFFPQRLCRPNIPLVGPQYRFSSPGQYPQISSHFNYPNMPRQVPNLTSPRHHMYHIRPPSLV